jgi:hypothetical protein
VSEPIAGPIHEYVITPHAAGEMRRRGISEATLHRVMSGPEQRRNLRSGRDVLQARIELSGKTYLLRAFVDVDRRPAEVVTIYRTSKIAKYWRSEP